MEIERKVEIVKKEVKTYEVKLMCECGKEMECTAVWHSYPPSYTYKCRECNNAKVLGEKFPRIIYG